MKYIIVKDREDRESAIVFPDRVIHKDVARIHRASDVRVVSAGFCRIGETVLAWGESESLKMKSRPEDRDVIAADYSHKQEGTI